MNTVKNRIVRVAAIDGVPVAVAFVIMVIFFSVSSPFFLTATNLTNLFVESVFSVLLAAAMTYVLVVGGIDLSVGSVMGLSAGMTLLALMNGAPLIVGIAVGIGTGFLVGVINGALIAGLGVNDFIVTLATLSIAAGSLQVLTSSTLLTGVDSADFAALTDGSIAGVPTPVVITAVVVIVLELILIGSSFGRRVYAAGINGRAAFLAGVGVRALRMKVYILSGTIAGFAGVLLASHLNSVQPGLGSGYELTAIAAAVLGGISLSGGRGSVWRSVVGALFLATLAQGLQLLGVDPIWFGIITGASIVIAVAFDRGIARLVSSTLASWTPRKDPVPETPLPVEKSGSSPDGPATASIGSTASQTPAAPETAESTGPRAISHF